MEFYIHILFANYGKDANPYYVQILKVDGEDLSMYETFLSTPVDLVWDVEKPITYSSALSASTDDLYNVLVGMVSNKGPIYTYSSSHINDWLRKAYGDKCNDFLYKGSCIGLLDVFRFLNPTKSYSFVKACDHYSIDASFHTVKMYLLKQKMTYKV